MRRLASRSAVTDRRRERFRAANDAHTGEVHRFDHPGCAALPANEDTGYRRTPASPMAVAASITGPRRDPAKYARRPARSAQLVPSACFETAAATVCHTRRRATPSPTRPGKRGVSIHRPVAACLSGYEWRRRSRSQAATSACWRASARRDCSWARLLELARGLLSVSPAPLSR
jgi:hypothetical protein